MTTEHEMRGVRLGDVYRDHRDDLWEVVGLCGEPQATVRRVFDQLREQHVIGCQNWSEKWASGPLRGPDPPADPAVIGAQ